MTAKLEPGQQAPDFDLPAVDGSNARLADELGTCPVTVVLFLCNHCPYVVAYIPRLIELQNEFDPSGGKGNRATSPPGSSGSAPTTR